MLRNEIEIRKNYFYSKQIDKTSAIFKSHDCKVVFSRILKNS